MIIHVDIDAFYPSLEELRNPEMKGKPVVVCMFTREGQSGAVASANYKAREHGIKSGMPLAVAKARAPAGTFFLQADREYYQRKSMHIMEDLKEFGRVEQASVDEAYIEVEDGQEIEIGKAIQQHIKKKFGLDCTIGIGKNKLLAKMASKVSKPRGFKVAKSIEDFYEYSVRLIPGVGERTAAMLKEKGINTIEDLARTDPLKIKEWFPNKLGDLLIRSARGEGETHVEEEKERKQMGKIMTLPEDTSSKEELKHHAKELCKKVYERIEGAGVFFSSVSVLFIDKNMDTATRSMSISPSKSLETLERAVETLIDRYENGEVRRLGVFVSKFSDGKQKSLLEFVG